MTMGFLDLRSIPTSESTGTSICSTLLTGITSFTLGRQTTTRAPNDYNSATIGRLTRYTCRAVDDFRSVDLASRFILLGETKQTGIADLFVLRTGSAAWYSERMGLCWFQAAREPVAETRDSGGTVTGSYAPQALADGIIQPKEDVGAFRAQLVDCLSGKILRLDPATGNGEPSNPFYDSAHPRAPNRGFGHWDLEIRFA